MKGDKKEEEANERQSRDAITISELREEFDQQDACLQNLEGKSVRLRVEVERAHDRTELECDSRRPSCHKHGPCKKIRNESVNGECGSPYESRQRPGIIDWSIDRGSVDRSVHGNGRRSVHETVHESVYRSVHGNVCWSIGVSLEPVTRANLTSAALLAHHLPPSQKFSGELHGEDGETFQDWKVQFEMVASCGDIPDKPPNITNELVELKYLAYISRLRCNTRLIIYGL